MTADIKQEEVAAKGITLIPVPCWWDGTKQRYVEREVRRRSEKQERRWKEVLTFVDDR